MAKAKTPAPLEEKDRRELRALLAECRADPDDDASRLVLADWLEERGDDRDRARGELVRLQVNRPGCQSCSAGGEARQRERELTAEHARDWLGPLEFLCNPSRTRFERGLVTLQVEPRQFLTQYAGTLADSEAYAWVDSLSFYDLKDEDIPDMLDSPLFESISHLCLGRRDWGWWDRHLELLARSPRLAQLRGLTLSWPSRNPAETAALAASPYLAGLRWLSVQRTTQSLDAFLPLLRAPALAGLTRLDLSINPLGPKGLGDLLTCSLPRLRALELNSCQLDDTAELGRLAEFRSLATLDLSGNQLGEQALARLAGGDLPHLVDLYLYKCDVSSAGLAALASAPFLSHLRVLVLAENKVDVRGLRPLARGPGLKELRLLDLDSNPLGPQGGAALTALSLPCLEQLSLANCQFGPDGVARLAGWPSLQGVRSLNLACNALSDDGLRTLLESPCLTSLTYLDIERNAVGDAAVEALAESPLLARLRTLRLGDNALTGRAVEALVKSPHVGNLRRLSLGTLRFQLTGEVARQARKRFGKRLQ